MRITNDMFPSMLINELGTLSTQQNQLQNQAATGQRVQMPEDDPSAMRRVLDMQARSQSVGQYRTNIAQLQEMATASYNGIQAIKTISDRASEIATSVDGTTSKDALATYATEVTQLIQQAVQSANTQWQGNYIFGGTQNNQPPFTVATDASGNVSSVTYQGNASTTSAEIAQKETVSVEVPGANSTGSGARGLVSDTRSGADLFSHLISLQNHLLAGDTTAITSTDLPNLGKDEDNILYQVSNNGAVQSQLEAADAVASDQQSSLGTLVSREADADLSQTLVRLNETQSAYQAALQSGAMILHQSLMDYLH
jgi:flagellar hook-associated protein 3 FlgL